MAGQARRQAGPHEGRLRPGAELERIFGAVVQLVEVCTLDELVTAVRAPEVVGVALDAPPAGELREAAAAAGLAPRAAAALVATAQHRGQMDEVFDRYGLAKATDIVRLADGELSTT